MAGNSKSPEKHAPHCRDCRGGAARGGDAPPGLPSTNCSCCSYFSLCFSGDSGWLFGLCWKHRSFSMMDRFQGMHRMGALDNYSGMPHDIPCLQFQASVLSLGFLGVCIWLPSFELIIVMWLFLRFPHFLRSYSCHSTYHSSQDFTSWAHARWCLWFHSLEWPPR